MIVIIRLMNLGSIPDQVSRHILEHFNVEGALPLTEDRVRIMLQEFTRGIENRIDVLMNQAYSILCRRLYPNQDLEAVRIYDKTYNTIYERLQLLKNRIPHDRNVGAAEE